MSQTDLTLQVQRDDPKTHRFVEHELGALADGQIRFRVDRFALTANNISYAVAGEMLGYWRFFPVPGPDEGWGHIPAMGHADVIESAHPDVEVGTRCFGFFPMGRYAVIEPASVGSQIIAGGANREGIALAYNQYSPVDRDPSYVAEHEDHVMLLRGLFMTSFLADDYLGEHDYHGAESLLVTSASSKTSIALAQVASKREGLEVVGFTSARNRDFVASLGCYDRVLLYDEVGQLDAATPSVVVDMAADGPFLRAVHGHFDQQLRFSCSIGATHWESERNTGELPGPKPEFFFAPGQIAKRSSEWGPGVLQEKLGGAWLDFRAFTDGFLKIERSHGREALERVYTDTLAGRSDPATGQIVSAFDA